MRLVKTHDSGDAHFLTQRKRGTSRQVYGVCVYVCVAYAEQREVEVRRVRIVLVSCRRGTRECDQTIGDDPIEISIGDSGGGDG